MPHSAVLDVMKRKSRAKERVYSFRDGKMQWDPKNQRPELRNLYNGQVNHSKEDVIRVFPLSNWTELDIWLSPFTWSRFRLCPFITPQNVQSSNETAF